MEFFLEHPMLVTYLFLKLDVVLDLLAVIAVLGSMGMVFWTIICLHDHDRYPYHFKKFLALIITSGALCVLLPGAKDIAIMYGVSAGVTVGKNIATSPISSKALALLDTYVENELDKAKNKLEKSK